MEVFDSRAQFLDFPSTLRNPPFGCGSKLNDRRGKPRVWVPIFSLPDRATHFGIPVFWIATATWVGSLSILFNRIRFNGFLDGFLKRIPGFRMEIEGRPRSLSPLGRGHPESQMGVSILNHQGTADF